jgi:recombination associated protein RdgC
MLELEYMTQNNCDYVPVKEKRAIKQNVEEKRLMQMPPQMSGTPFVIDRNTWHLYLGASSTKAIDTFLTFFHDTFSISPLPVDFEDIMTRHFGETPQALPCVTFSRDMNEPDFMPGRDFLTWLWYHSEEKGGSAPSEGDGPDFISTIEGPLTFALMDETHGAGETVVKKGIPQNSAEAKAALAVGKKLKKAKINIFRGEQIWSGTLDADTLAFSGLSLPDGEEMDIHGAFEERVNFLDAFRDAFESYVKTFVEQLKSDDWKEEQERIHKWSEERASL